MMTQNNNDAQTNRTDPMDEKQDVRQSNDEKIQQDFPGFPGHPSKPATMSADTSNPEEDRKLQETDAAENRTGVAQRFEPENESRSEQQLPNADKRNQEIEDETGVPQNVTRDDLENPQDIPGSNPEQAADR